MDEGKHLILLKGEDKTAQVSNVEPVEGGGRYQVTFTGKPDHPYPYRAEHVDWRQDPVPIDMATSHIELRGTELAGVCKALLFKATRPGAQDWYRIWRTTQHGTRPESHPSPELSVRRAKPSELKAKELLAYLKQLAGLNTLCDGILSRYYARLSRVEPGSALACYLGAEAPAAMPASSPILPFGGNSSQLEATRKALEDQISVIQGPPGTGKTQVILTIIANLLVLGKSVLVVSNNNAATQNVLDKLSAPGIELDFLVAPLGSRDNKAAFLEEQPRIPPGLAAHRLDQPALAEKRQRIDHLVKTAEDAYRTQADLAQARQQLSELELETKYHENAEQVSADTGKRARAVSSETLLRLLLECEDGLERTGKLPFLAKVRLAFAHGIARWGQLGKHPSQVPPLLRMLFYRAKTTELEARVAQLEGKLERLRAEQAQQELANLSLEYLLGMLAQRYDPHALQPELSEDDLWRHGDEVLERYPVVLSTTFSATESLPGTTYDYLIMDEASQVDIATGALSLACARNAVIVGDSAQLPPVLEAEDVQQAERICAECAAPVAYSYSRSFLESVCQAIPDAPRTLLREHYRCHPSIIGFCNKRFYHGQLVVMTQADDQDEPLVLVQTVPGNHRRGHKSQRQIDVLREEVMDPLLREFQPGQIGVIAPYREHVAAVDGMLAQTRGALAHDGIEVDTVHKFQGREKDAVVLMTVDDTVTGFSDEPHLVNVAVSRAKRKLVLITSGNEQPRNSNIGDLADYMRCCGAVVESEVRSVFDLLYQCYDEARAAFLKGGRRVSGYDSENLMRRLLDDLLASNPGYPYSVLAHYPLGLLVPQAVWASLPPGQAAYAANSCTHVDFLVYNRVTKRPVLAIEVDGASYHLPGTRQGERDEMKNGILARCGIELLRLRTDGSREREALERALF